MPAIEQLDALGSLGQRLRTARRQKGLSQSEVAEPWFTKSYISAVERNKVRPSLKALQRIAARLEIPVPELLAEPVSDEGATRLAQAEREFAAQLDQANWLLNRSQADSAGELLDGAPSVYGDQWEQFAAANRFRFYLLRAGVGIRTADILSAREDLEQALELAGSLPRAVEETARARNLLGLTYYELDMPHQALEYHELCLRDVRSGAINDLGLRFAIYSNTANDYQALGDKEGAAAIYQEALDPSAQPTNLEQQAQLYWNLATEQSGSDPEQAQQYRAQALALFDTAQNFVAAARLRISLAEFRLVDGDYPEAERLLQEAAQILPDNGDGLIWSALFERQATLELRRGQVAEAERLAAISLQSGALAYESRDALDGEAQAQLLTTYARVLRTVALLAEMRGDRDEADELFSRALALLSAAPPVETVSEIEFDYAEILRARGAHEAAGEHYRLAYEHRQRRR